MQNKSAEDLKRHFITENKEFREGDVYVFSRQFKTRKTGIRGKKVESATLISTALGVYEVDINGKKVGKQLFAPGYTFYKREVLYQENDVTELLNTAQDGENEIRIYLGQGWYCGRYTFDNKVQIYGKKPAVSFILTLLYEDGTKDEIVSGTDVDVLESPYGYAGEYDGEIYYAAGAGRIDHAGHPDDAAGAGSVNDAEGQGTVCDPDRVIGKAVLSEEPTDFELSPSVTEVHVQEEMPVQKVLRDPDGRTILDFGQNFAGIIDINPSFLPERSVLTIRHGEILDKEGRLYTANLRKAKQTIEYHAGQHTASASAYRPRFTYMGFRYAEVTGAEYKPGLITAHAVYTDMKRTGFFSCENADVQKLYDNQLWGQKSNYVEVPTDCPQRDEREGYTGDGQVFALTASYNFDTDAFMRKFLRDMEETQKDNTEGYIPSVVPGTKPEGEGIGFLNMLGWGTAVTRIPEILRIQYGDTGAAEQQYESMKTFVDCEIRKMGKKHLWIAPNLGDWLALGKGMAWQAMHNGPVSNAFIVNDLRILSETAQRLGKEDDEERYGEQLEATREAYIKKFVDEKTGIVAKDYQSGYIMALAYVIPEGELRTRVLSKFRDNVKKEGMTTGFFATEFILPLLVEAGDPKLAYDVLLHDTCPGWMYQVKAGATTTWERWDALRPDGTVNEEKSGSDNMVSFNHYAFGSVGEFYYAYILGIRPLEDGYRKVLIQPYPDERLKKVSGKYISRAGEISSAWEYSGNQILFDITVPVGAEIRLPDGEIHKVGAGTWHYEIKRK